MPHRGHGGYRGGYTGFGYSPVVLVNQDPQGVLDEDSTWYPKRKVVQIIKKIAPMESTQSADKQPVKKAPVKILGMSKPVAIGVGVAFVFLIGFGIYKAVKK